MPAILPLLAGAGGSAAMGALFTLLEQLFRKGGRRRLGASLKPGSIGQFARRSIGKRSLAGAATFGAFDLALSLLGEGTPEEELQASNQHLKGFANQAPQQDGSADIEELLALLASQGAADDTSGLFL